MTQTLYARMNKQQQQKEIIKQDLEESNCFQVT
jgi:hypothetical protein